MATTAVILREKIDNLGAEADVVNVKRGFARNFLIPHGKAFEATKGNLRNIEALKKARAEREAEELNEANSLAGKIKKTKLTLELSIGEGGKAFGSITTKDIADALNERSKRFNIDRHQLQLERPIKGTGSFDIPVKLHPEVSATLNVKVIAEKSADSGDEENDD